MEMFRSHILYFRGELHQLLFAFFASASVRELNTHQSRLKHRWFSSTMSTLDVFSVSLQKSKWPIE